MSPQHLSIFYDGECPVCSRYVQYYRLTDGEFNVSLVDLRQHPEEVARFSALGLEVDEGMVVALGDQILHGSEAVHVLALLSTPVGLFNRLNRWLFSRRRLAHIFYPVLVSGRNILLFMLGREKIHSSGS